MKQLKTVNDLRPMIPNITWKVNNEVDLCYSTDDNCNTGKGWYFSNRHGTSQLFATDRAALTALSNNSLKFD